MRKMTWGEAAAEFKRPGSPLKRMLSGGKYFYLGPRARFTAYTRGGRQAFLYRSMYSRRTADVCDLSVNEGVTLPHDLYELVKDLADTVFHEPDLENGYQRCAFDGGVPEAVAAAKLALMYLRTCGEGRGP